MPRRGFRAGHGAGWPSGGGVSQGPRCVGCRGVRPGQQVIRCLVAARSRLKASAQGQPSGRCGWIRRAEEAILAGVLIRVLRKVAPVALAWNGPAMWPTARMRLNAAAGKVAEGHFLLSGSAHLRLTQESHRWIEAELN